MGREAFLLQSIQGLGFLSINGPTILETSIFRHINEGKVDREAASNVTGPHFHLHPIGEFSVSYYHPSARETEKWLSSSVPERAATILVHVGLSSFSPCSQPRKALGPRPTRMANHPSSGRRDIALVKNQRLCEKTRADGEPQ